MSDENIDEQRLPVRGSIMSVGVCAYVRHEPLFDMDKQVSTVYENLHSMGPVGIKGETGPPGPLTDTFCYGQWECESCQDIFVAETINEESAVCPACDLECLPCYDGTGGVYVLTYDDQKPDAVPKTVYLYESAIEPDTTPLTVVKWDGDDQPCSCDSRALFNFGCKCGGL